MLMTTPIRVAQVMGKMVGGGVEQVVMNYYRHIDRSKVQFDFLVDEDSTLVPREEIESLGGRVFKIPPYQRVFAYQKTLVKLFREQRWPIVHSHVNALSVFPLRAAKRAGVPVRIAHSHSTAGKGEPARNVVKYLLKHFSTVYPTDLAACSDHAGRWLFGEKSSFTIIPNAIELTQFRFDRAARERIRTKLDIPDDAFVIGHVGRFMPQKNHLFLLSVFEKVSRVDSGSILALVGSGPLQGQIRDQVEEMGLHGRVIFLGQLDEVGQVYQAFDLFALPSLYEGLGMVAIEAQASGLPCFVSPNVPNDVDVSSRCLHLPLDEDCWCAEIIKFARSSSVRTIASDPKLKSYDIDLAAPKLLRYYLDRLAAHMRI